MKFCRRTPYKLTVFENILQKRFFLYKLRLLSTGKIKIFRQNKHPSVYCLLYAKILKEAETEETILFFVTFLSLVPFQLEGGLPGPPSWLRLCQRVMLITPETQNMY